MATVFVGGSALLLAAAMASLAFGFANGEEPLVWIALVASGAAALFLVIAYVISRRDLRRATAETSTRESSETTETTEATEAQTDTQNEPPAEQVTEPRNEPQDEQVTEAPSTPGAGSPTAAKPSTTKKPSAPGTAAAAKPSSPSDAVVGIATKKKFHRTECRYARSESAEEMTRAAARRRGFTPCGICKP